MKTRISIYSVLVLAALAISAVSCNRIIDEFDAGGPIRFSASTEYDNGPFTRTAYSGYVFGTSTLKERINWVKNDPITINYKQEGESTFQTGKYQIKDGTISEDEASSVASIEPVTDELYWGENSSKSHVFYAMYPSKGFGGNNKADLVGNTVSGYIPDTQVPTKSGRMYIADMKYAYMVAMATVGYTIPPSVQLPFCPAFTAFQLNINSDNSTDITVSKVELEADTNLAGDFSFDITGGNATGATWSTSGIHVTNGVKKITVDFSASPVTVNNSIGRLDLTLLALPIQQSGLKITFTTSVGTKVLRLNDASNNPVVFAPCKKYVISNDTLPGGESWTYTIEDIDPITVYGHLEEPDLPFTVKSYKTNESTHVTAPVEWEVDYATSASGPFYSTPADAGISDRFNVSAPNRNGGTVGEAASAIITRDHNGSNSQEYSHFGSIDTEEAAIATLRGRTTLPTAASDGDDHDGYYDLSKHPVYGTIDGAEEPMETANCYVITAPGKYKFPTVYGNAIRNGATNERAYAPQGTSAGVLNDNPYFMRRFLRHDNQPIAGPWIFDDNCGAVYGSCDAVVVWQDVSSVDKQILLDEDISISSDGKYILFEIKKNNIRPGNICLALRYGSGHTILWSWHIWVTEKNLTPITVNSKIGPASDMMPYNLGWTDARDAGGYKWVDWTFYVRIRQTETGGTQKVFAVNQIGESETVDANVGSNTFYQWGRKDPMLPAKSSNENKAYYSAQGYVITENSANGPRVITEETPSSSTLQVGYAIQHPYKIYHNPSIHHWLAGNASTSRIGNLWDVNLITVANPPSVNAISINNRISVKSVYDPCPRGFVVPWTFAFTLFTDQGYNYNGVGVIQGTPTTDGINFVTGNTPSSIYFPYCGARGGDGNSPIYDVKSLAYYWTAGSLPYNDATESSRYKAKHLWFNRSNAVRPIFDQFKEGAYSVRPVIQTNFTD